jgi:transposase-like protein
MTKQVRQYDKDFKEQAVRLYMSRETSYPKLGKELGIPSSTLAAWVREYSKALEKDSNSSSLSVHEEMMKLRKEVSHLREERDILKKALAIFSKAKA